MALAMSAPTRRSDTKPLGTAQTQQIKAQMAHRNHLPGYYFKMHDGTEYHSTKSGAWRRVTSRRCSNATNLKNHGVRRRLKSERTRV